jgi:glycosyltransferase involved in cell wall biosynthesis
MERKPRIFIGLREVAGYFGNLKAGFDQLGVQAVFMNLGGNRFNYSEGKNPAWVRFFSFIGKKLGRFFSINFLLRFIWLVFFQYFFSFFALLIAIFKCNIFIMGSSSTFLFFLELPLLKLLRKKIIYIFLGTDSRPAYLNGYLMNNTKNTGIYVFISFMQRTIIRIIESFADHIVNHPPQAHFHKKKFISLLCLGIPFDITRISGGKSTGSIKDKVRILHAPSKSGPKGSAFFRKTISALKTKGYPIDYVEISGMTNAEVLKNLAECDFIFDQLYSDTPMAVFAAEAAFSGKPAVVGSYYAYYLKNDIPEEYIPPSVFCHPEQIVSRIEEMINNKQLREDLGKRANDFVLEHWKAEFVANNYLKLINKEIPEEWFFDPARLNYPFGCGLSEKNARQNISAIIKKWGRRALSLHHNKKLEQSLINFANNTCQGK